MKNGRLYKGDNLDEMVTGNSKVDRKEYLDKKPVKNTKVAE
jgi:hypothetical protein